MTATNGALKLSEEEDLKLRWGWVVAELTEEALQIQAILDELIELGNPDFTAAISMWNLAYQGGMLVAKNHFDPDVRAKFKACLVERRKVMTGILKRVRKMQRAS